MKRGLLILCIALCSALSAGAQTYGWLAVEVDSTSDGAALYVDGKYVTNIPATIELAKGKHELTVKKPKYDDYVGMVQIEANNVKTMNISLQKNFNAVSIQAMDEASIYINGKLAARGEWNGDLVCGDYDIEVRCQGYNPLKKSITVELADRAQQVRLTQMTPITGTLSVHSTVSGAAVLVDGKNVGTTPLSLRGIKVGDYKVRVEKRGYTSSESMVSIEQNKTATVSLQQSPLGYVDFETNVSEAAVEVDGRIYQKGEYPTSLEIGEHEVAFHASDYKSKAKKVNIEQGVVNSEYVKLQKYYFQPFGSDIHVTAGVQAIRYPALEFSVGSFVYKGIMIGLDYNYGLTSKSASFVDESSVDSETYEFRPSFFNLKIGWGSSIGTRIRLSGFVGIGTTMLKSKDYENSNFYETYGKTSVSSLNAGARLEVALVEAISLYLQPSYTLPMKKHDGALNLLALNPEFNKYIQGFNASLGVCFYLGL